SSEVCSSDLAIPIRRGNPHQARQSPSGEAIPIRRGNPLLCATKMTTFVVGDCAKRLSLQC
ncbi:MAG: hypothetical protein LBK01_06150, partial [Burkholderiaceae bacterium]|nr:hypothetical protein [Burkholderiaceae bacterium]